MTIPHLLNGTPLPALPKTMAETSDGPTSERTHVVLNEVGGKEPAISEFADLFIAEAENALSSAAKPNAQRVVGDADTAVTKAPDTTASGAEVSDQDKVAGSDTKDILPALPKQRSSSGQPSQATSATEEQAQNATGSRKIDQPKLGDTSLTEAAFNAQDKHQMQAPQKASVNKVQPLPLEAEIPSSPVKHSGTTLLTRPAAPDSASKMQTKEAMASTPMPSAAPFPQPSEKTGLRQNPSKVTTSIEAVPISPHSGPSSKLAMTPANAALNSAKSREFVTASFAQAADPQRSSNALFRQDGSLQATQQTKTGPTAISVKMAAQSPVSSTIQNSIEQSLSLLVPSDAPESMSWDQIRTNASTQASTIPLRADLAPHVARQIGEAMTQASHRPTEIALSPKELGRVQMSVLADDGAVTINILAERPDTLDLMRRHIDQLGQTLRSMGYDSINFAFGHGAHGDETSDKNTHHASSEKDAHTHRDSKKSVEDANPVIHVTSATTQGVDIRL